MTSTRVADIIVETLQKAGVKRCYGIVGDTLNHVTDAIFKSQIDWVHVRHEEAAAFAAGAEAQITDELTACAGSCGPGSLHFINGIYEANRNRVPVVLIASQLASSQLGTHYPQEVDFKAVYSNCSVFCEQVQNADQAQRITAMAANAALNERGVAVIVLPADISASYAKSQTEYKIYRPKPVVRPNDDELQQLVKHLEHSQKIAIYAGAGAKGAHDEIIALAQKLKAPIGHTTRAKDFIAYDNPYNMGMTGIYGVKSGFEMMMNCDTLLLLGTDFAFTQFYPNQANIIQIDANALNLGHRHPVSLGLVGDVKATVEALLPLVQPHDDSQFLDNCLKTKAKTEETTREQEAKSFSDIIHPQYLMRLISDYADDDALFSADVGTAQVWTLRHLEANGKRRTVTSLLHATMANGMPQALGLKKAFPERQVISVSGDGGLTMLMGDMITAVQEELPIKIVVMNNGSLNFVELEQKVEGLVNRYTDLKNPDFAELSAVMGYKSWKVDKPNALEKAVKAFLAADGPALLDVHTNAYELIMPPKIEMSQVTSTALYGVRAVMEGHSKDVKNLLINNFLE